MFERVGIEAPNGGEGLTIPMRDFEVAIRETKR